MFRRFYDYFTFKGDTSISSFDSIAVDSSTTCSKNTFSIERERPVEVAIEATIEGVKFEHRVDKFLIDEKESVNRHVFYFEKIEELHSKVFKTYIYRVYSDNVEDLTTLLSWSECFSNKEEALYFLPKGLRQAELADFALDLTSESKFARTRAKLICSYL